MEASTLFIIFSSLLMAYVHSADRSRMCDNVYQCHSNECCVSNYQPKGKRFLDLRGHRGHCVPMGVQNAGCLVRYGNATVRPTNIVLACPCAPGLYCHGDKVIEIPLGERGHCTSV